MLVGEKVPTVRVPGIVTLPDDPTMVILTVPLLLPIVAPVLNSILPLTFKIVFVRWVDLRKILEDAEEFVGSSFNINP